ncbi:Rep family protein [Ligilactobacillus salivarius]|uniref:Rep family protein n=1 Tax=Ligilactobacillus salivarius TaxID=1624 RepID=UPI002150920A|nr:Rep family protein [Ligilactobacillus salivarius]MDH4961095.1 Rep family protein [Ligilactobacillus salivarius]UUY24527.1 Rep family protein [Ligilactobacillus salivarius]
MTEEVKKDQRARTWTFVVYPESAPKNWVEMLDGYHVPWIQSPLHDKDVNPDGEKKKAHWHIVMLFDGKKSYSQIKEITDSINSPIPQKTLNTRGLVRYLIHMDNPEKYQYDRSEIVSHAGADVDQYFQLSTSSKNAVLWDIVQFIKQNKVDSLIDLMDYVQANELRDWFDIICNRNSIIIKAVIDSVYQKSVKRAEQQAQQADPKLALIAQAKQMASQGYSLRDISNKLGISKSTVDRYLKK